MARNIWDRFPTFSALATSNTQDRTKMGAARVSARFCLDVPDEERLRNLRRDREFYAGTCNTHMVRTIDARIAEIHARS